MDLFDIVAARQGIQCETGPQGPQGEQGPKGPKGDKGEPGKSAYELAKEGGYEGTEENFTRNLVNLSDYNRKISLVVDGITITYNGLSDQDVVLSTVNSEAPEGTPIYYRELVFPINHFSYNSGDSLKDVTWSRDNLPPATYDFSNGSVIAKYDCNFSNEIFITDGQKVEADTEIMYLSLEEFKMICAESGISVSFERISDDYAHNVRFLYKMKVYSENKEAIEGTSEMLNMIKMAFLGFKETYHKIPTPVEVVSEVL